MSGRGVAGGGPGGVRGGGPGGVRGCLGLRERGLLGGSLGLSAHGRRSHQLGSVKGGSVQADLSHWLQVEVLLGGGWKRQQHYTLLHRCRLH